MNLIMEVLKSFKKKDPKKAIDLLQQISKRAEDLTPEEQAKSFVAIRRIDGALKNRDSRILFGRRGTGKTHILSYVANSANSGSDVAFTLDLRTLGSNNSIYSDQTIAPDVRATRLIRDLLFAIHDRLLDHYTSPQSRFDGENIYNSLKKLSECVRTVVVNQTQEVRQKERSTNQVGASASGEATLSLMGGSATASASGSLNKETSEEAEKITTGVPILSINMGQASKAFSEIADAFKGRIWILLDEWSALPELLQPYLADFIRRAMLPIQNITVQIAAIEFRSSFRLDFEGHRIGFELGSDIFADINLDDYFVYDSNALTAIEFFQALLYRHLIAFAADDGLVEKSAAEVINAVFSQERVFSELVRASEGVARDFINILQLAAMRSSQTRISMNDVRAASKDWFERDKQRNLDTNLRAQALLDWIRDEVIEGRKARAFLLQVNDNDPAIEFLFDERMLHIARRSYSAKDEPGVRYRVWKVDYGCYVDLINTQKAPTGFLLENVDMTDAGEIRVPEDDYRAVRRAVLNIEDFNRSYGS